jgi:hypothetical protein
LDQREKRRRKSNVKRRRDKEERKGTIKEGRIFTEKRRK